MRIVFRNLHTNSFYLQDLRRLLTGQNAIDKHSFLLTHFLNNDVEIVNFISVDGTTLPSKLLRNITNKLFFRLLESYFVIWRSKFPINKIRCIKDVNDIKPTDIIWMYGHHELSIFNENEHLCGISLVDHIHFYGDYNTSHKIELKKPHYYTSEIDLEKYCGLYNLSYSWFTGRYIPRKFAFNKRFINDNSFEDRKNKALAIGTVTYCNDETFVDFYGSNVYQPLRKMILDAAEEMNEYIDSFISDYQEIPLKKYTTNDSIIKKFFFRLFNYWHTGKQKKYFSFNMVDKFNSYRMFICPEDITGAYGIGAIEGMACGCAMIGLNNGIYEDIGLIEGIHYIGYDGSLKDLKDKISYYQQDVNFFKLKTIAETGYKYIREHFSQEVVAREFLLELEKVISEKALRKSEYM